MGRRKAHFNRSKRLATEEGVIFRIHLPLDVEFVTTNFELHSYGSPKAKMEAKIVLSLIVDSSTAPPPAEAEVHLTLDTNFQQLP